MAHYRLLDRLPSAIVTTDGSEKKVYEGNIVFFNKGDNFELRFFNPLQEKIGVEIIFNGQKKSDSLLIINPGEDIKLDRFLDDNKKMVFDTYYIDSNNPSAVEAAELNGKIIINFYKEKFISNYTTSNFSTLNNTGGMGTINYQKDNWFPSTNASGPSGINGADGISGFDNSTSSVNYSDYVAESLTTDINYSDYTNDRILINNTISKSSSQNENSRDYSLETGRIEKGEISNQKFKNVDIVFDSNPFHTTYFQLKPFSTKKQTRIAEIRNYCHSCGYRIRKETWKFCPKCGEKLI